MANGVELVSVAAPGRRCEDYAAAVDGLVVVLDGVTPPHDGDSGCVHDVPWFVDLLGRTLLEVGQRHGSLADCLAEAIERTAAAHRTTCDLSHPRTPQATVAMLRWDDVRVEHLVLSDAAVLLGGQDGTVTAVLDSRLDELRARPYLAALRAGPEVGAYRTALEALRNVPDGFHTAAADPAVVAHAVTGATPRAAVRAAAALTDGATRWRDKFDLGDWADLLEVLRSAGPAALVEQVRTAETADADRRNFRRGKVFDDASAAYVDLGDGV
ncbi:hypothetical protein [Actinophytocola sp.]|uniref:hypothetical protein n=1 Tax=Actinophytocola sp. TaxID=1872138 RepID=UPI002ED5E47F